MKNNLLLAPQRLLMTEVTPTSTLVVFDERVSDIETILKALLPGATGFILGDRDDGLLAITKLLAETGAKYLAIVAHGEPGVVHLGNSPINIGRLQAQSLLLSEWGVKEIALYSCEVAKGDVGKDLIYQLSELTGATVAAAATKIGARTLGGNWNLSVATGEIDSPMLFEASILESYQAVLPVRFFGGRFFSRGVITQHLFVTTGDFNGDGNLDLVTANAGSNDVSFFLGNGSGDFSITSSNLGGGTQPVSVTTGDFNGDGKLDLVTANLGTNNISVLLNNGSGFTATTFAVGLVPKSVTVGDFNRDGKLDLATADASGISVRLGNGNGGFSDATNFAIGAAPYSIKTGDFNGDNILDLVTANVTYTGSVGNISVLFGNGSGGFGTATNFTGGYGSSKYLTTGDFNGDGKLDLATTNTFGAVYDIVVLLNNGSGGFGAANNFAIGGTAESLTTGDFNGDGKLDLATSSRDSSYLSVLLGNGSGSFVYTNGFQTQQGGHYSVTAGDFNNDGRIDLAASNSGVTVLLNNSFTRNDFNGDGKSDILWRNTDGSVAEWEMNSLTATPKSVGALPAGWTIAGTGDFSGEGKADILLRNTANGSVATWQMNGSTITKATTIGTLTSGWSIAGTGDFNGDGISDVLLTNTDGSVAQWEMNNSTVTAAKTVGKLSAGWSIAGTGDFDREVTRADRDEKADILLKNTNGSIAVWQMDGATVTYAKIIGAITPDWTIAGTGSFIGASASDAILFRNTNGSVAEWQMYNSQVYSTSIIGTATTDWKITETGDYNGDGKADILWRNDNGSVAEWQMNGSNVLAAGLTSIPSAATSWTIAAPIG
jgi:hypothetical protein